MMQASFQISYGELMCGDCFSKKTKPNCVPITLLQYWKYSSIEAKSRTSAGSAVHYTSTLVYTGVSCETCEWSGKCDTSVSSNQLTENEAQLRASARSSSIAVSMGMA
eukprot:scpid106989/ scgid16830/ 